MSPSRTSWSFQHLRSRRQADGGFSLIEILVAITLLGLMSAAIVPLVVTGLRASVVAKLDTGAKNLTQQRFELIRNLPFRIGYDPLVTTGVDMLDTYFPDLGPPAGGVTTPGYVTTQPRRAGEPAAGPFYRTTFVDVVGVTTFTEYVATQFLTPSITPKVAVTPPAGYTTTPIAVGQSDKAPSTLVGVTVITEWQYGTKTKRLTVFSEISDVAPGAPLVSLQARAVAMRISSTVGLGIDQTDLLLESGVVNIDGSLSSGASAAVTSTGGFASTTPGVRVNGATLSKSAPPDAAVASASDNNSHDLTWQGDLVARVPRTTVDNVAAKTAGGEPIVGTSGTPIEATSLGSTEMRFDNRPNIDNSKFGFVPDTYFVARQPAAGASTRQAQATAYAGSIGGTAHSTSVGLTASTSVVNVLQTQFSPEGIMQVRLNSASLTCASNGTTATSTPAYNAEIWFRTYTPNPLLPSTGTYTWSSATVLTSSQATDPLAGVNLIPGPGGVAVGYQAGQIRYLGEYVQGLSSLTASGFTAARIVSPDGNRMEARPSAVVNISTVPLRAGEDLSSVNVGLGVLSCLAEDNR